MPTALIAGATGFIGSRVCEKLHEKKFNIIALKRPASDISHIRQYVKKFVTTDLLSPSCLEDIRSQLKETPIDYMIAAAGAVDYHQDYASAVKSNVDTTRSVIQIGKYLQKQSGLEKLIFVSSVAARGFLDNAGKRARTINELSDFHCPGVSVYLDVKREAEDLIFKAIRKEELKAVMVSPGSIVGKGLGRTATTSTGMIQKIIKGIPMLKGGVSFTSLQRVVEGIHLALEKGKIGELYLLGGENMTMEDFAVLVRSILKENFLKARQPIIPVFTIPGTVAGMLGRMNLVINHQQAVLGNAFHYIDSGKAETELGYHHSMADLKQSVTEVLDSLIL